MILKTALILVAVAGVVAGIRLAPADPAVWHDRAIAWDDAAPWDRVVPVQGGATLRLSRAIGPPEALLAQLDQIARATPRTTVFAGDLASGRITWVTRSRLWGFPDYTTAERRADGLYLSARLRFGQSDLGVNAARLTDWLARLTLS